MRRCVNVIQNMDKKYLVKISLFYMLIGILVFWKILYAAIFIPSIIIRLYERSNNSADEDTISNLESFLDFLEILSVYISSSESIETGIKKYVSVKMVQRSKNRFTNLIIYHSSDLNSDGTVFDFFKSIQNGFKDIVIISTFSRMIVLWVRTGGNIKEMIDETISNTRQQIHYRAEMQSSLSEKRMEISILSVMPYFFLFIMRYVFGDFFIDAFNTFTGILTLTVVFTVFEVSNSIASRIARIELQ